MNLKNFHIIFILAAILTCFGFAAWAFMADTSRVGDFRGIGGMTLAIGVGLIFYGLWFVLREAKRII